MSIQEGISSHAIVIGGSLAGLLTARVLSNHFERVTIIERDALPDSAEPRVGVPQGRQLHVLLARGRNILAELFPGVLEDMQAAGSVRIDAVKDVAWLYTQGWCGTFESGIVGEGCTRPLMELCVRRRLLENPRISIRESLDVVGLRAQAGAVTGVLVRPRGQREAPSEELAADFVADASGRGSRAPQWLQQIGYDAPEESLLNCFAGYATGVFRLSQRARALPYKGIYIQAQPPKHLRAGIVFPVEGDRWISTVYGLSKDYPPTDHEGFLEFTRGLRSSLLYNVLKDAELVEPIAPYRGTENRMRHYERLKRWPERFVLLGDSVFAFNPIYGQGITTAARGALQLDQTLQAGYRQTGLAARFQRELARVNRDPWMMATTEDYRCPIVEGPPQPFSARLMHRFLDRVVRRSSQDAVLNQAMMRVFHMLETPAIFFRPRLLVRLLGRSRVEQPHPYVPEEVEIPQAAALAAGVA